LASSFKKSMLAKWRKYCVNTRIYSTKKAGNCHGQPFDIKSNPSLDEQPPTQNNGNLLLRNEIIATSWSKWQWGMLLGWFDGINSNVQKSEVKKSHRRPTLNGTNNRRSLVHLEQQKSDASESMQGLRPNSSVKWKHHRPYPWRQNLRVLNQRHITNQALYALIKLLKHKLYICDSPRRTQKHLPCILPWSVQ